jgi:hypothetical protein
MAEIQTDLSALGHRTKAKVILAQSIRSEPMDQFGRS